MANNNLEKILTAMARKVADANHAAKNVSVSVDEHGEVSVNDKPQGFSIVTPSGVSQAVSGALSSNETASKIAEEQAAFAREQGLANQKIAIEKGVYYIEDALPNDLRNKALTGWWKDNKQTPEDAARVSRYIQDYLNNKVPTGVLVTSRIGNVFSVDKNVGHLPEVFGADGRKVTVGGMELTIDGAQPCIYVDKSKYRVFNFTGVTFIAETPGVSVFEFSSGIGNTVVHGGILRTRAWLEIGYKGGRQGLFSPLDGWTEERPDIASGYGDKGTHQHGFNTTTLNHDLARYRNNAARTEHLRQPAGMTRAEVERLTKIQATERYKSIGGFWNSDGTKSEFPLADGTTSEEWGLWRGAQRWSRANGYEFYGCRDTLIMNFDIRGFTGSAIQIGAYSTKDCRDVGGGQYQIAIDEGLVCFNTKVLGGYTSDNYTGGIGVVRAIGVIITGMMWQGAKFGHPDASVEHSRDGQITTVDPGYCLWTSRYLPMTNIIFINNVLGFGARKVCDGHTGNNIKILNNSGSCLYYGTGVVLEEGFASVGNAASKAEPNSFEYQDSNIEIAGNIFVSGCFGIFLINGAVGVKARRDLSRWWLRGNVNVHDNIVYAPMGVPANFGHDNFKIRDNHVVFALPFGEPYGMRHLSKVEVVNGGQNYSAATYCTVTGGGDGARDAKVELVIGQEKDGADKVGKILNVIVRQRGHKYSDAASVVFTITDPLGTGRGAELKAYVNKSTYAYMIGAEARYGTAFAHNVTGNTSENSPHGNFDRHFLLGNNNAMTFKDNRADVTPYVKGENSMLPFVSERAYVHNSGFGGMPFYPTGVSTDCEFSNNKSYDRVKDITTDWVPSNVKTTASGTNPKNVKPSVADVQSMIDEAVAKALKGISGPVQPSGPGGGNEQPAQPPVTPPVSVKSVKFSMTSASVGSDSVSADSGSAVLTSVKNAEKLADGSGYTGMVVQAGKFKAVQSFVPPESGKASRYINLTGLSVGDVPSTILVPFRVSAGGSVSGAATLAMVMNNGTAVTVASAGLNTGGDKWFAYPSNGFTLDGAAAKQTEEQVFDKWHIMMLKQSKAFDSIRFGTNHVTSAWRNIIVGEGLEIIEGDNPSLVQERYSALKAKYGIE